MLVWGNGWLIKKWFRREQADKHINSEYCWDEQKEEKLAIHSEKIGNRSNTYIL